MDRGYFCNWSVEVCTRWVSFHVLYLFVYLLWTHSPSTQSSSSFSNAELSIHTSCSAFQGISGTTVPGSKFAGWLWSTQLGNGTCLGWLLQRKFYWIDINVEHIVDSLLSIGTWSDEYAEAIGSDTTLGRYIGFLSITFFLHQTAYHYPRLFPSRLLFLSPLRSYLLRLSYIIREHNLPATSIFSYPSWPLFFSTSLPYTVSCFTCRGAWFWLGHNVRSIYNPHAKLLTPEYTRLLWDRESLETTYRAGWRARSH